MNLDEEKEGARVLLERGCLFYLVRIVLLSVSLTALIILIDFLEHPKAFTFEAGDFWFLCITFLIVFMVITFLALLYAAVKYRKPIKGEQEESRL
jgi:hypothetical protein